VGGDDYCGKCGSTRKVCAPCAALTPEDVEALRYADYMLVECAREAVNDEEFAKLHAAAKRLRALASAIDAPASSP
jgi:hypothetical protein